MKRTKSRLTKRGRKTRKNKTMVNRKRMRGGCGCDRSILGGSAGLAELPIRHYYDLRNEANNPAYMMKGGRSKKRVIKGGMSTFLLGQASNPITGYGEVSGILQGVSSSEADVTNQPIMAGVTKFYV
jgi:hypothetical protein